MPDISSPITTCREACAAWNAGETLTSVNISGMGSGYELACQRILFAAIEQHLDREGDVEYWDDLAGNDASLVFTDASTMAVDAGMTGAMFLYSVSAAVVALRNGWAKAHGMVAADRLFEVRRESESSGA